jgi:CubicO group peptidase (beta-lactamase class C family)
MLLATIAEKASGKDFIALCGENIFIPLKMTSTAIRTKEEKLKVNNMAWGHLYVPEKKAYVQADSFPEFNYSLWLGHRKGPGRISSTCSDLQKWDDALYSGQLVTNETIAEAFSPATLNNGSFSNYGFGWTLKQDERGKVVLHTGDNPGYKTIIIRYLDFRQTVIVLNNNGHEHFDRLVKGITSILDGTSAHKQAEMR